MSSRDFNKCKTCKEWHWTDEKCKPVFFFKHDNWGEEWQEIRASNFEEASIKFAQLYNDDCDYPLINSSEMVLISDGKTEKAFSVSAEPDIYYSSRELLMEEYEAENEM